MLTPEELKALSDIEDLRRVEIFRKEEEEPNLKQLKEIEKLCLESLSFRYVDYEHLTNGTKKYLENSGFTIKNHCGIPRIYWP